MNVNEILYISKGGVKPTNNKIFSVSLMDYYRKDYTKEFNYFMLSKEIQRIFPREVLLEQGMIEVDNPFTEDKMYKFKEVSEDLKTCRFCKHLCTDIANQVACDLGTESYLDDYYCDHFELNEVLKKHI